MVINLSDRTYDYSHFGNRVVCSGYPDHHSPTLSMMWSLYCIIDFWLSLDKENVIAVHCLAGKGRTGITVVCTLLMQGYFNNLKHLSILDVINVAINYFHDIRGDGVENPDQIRFIYQFLQSMDTMGSDMLLLSNLSLQPSVFVSHLIMYNLPVGDGGILTPRLCVYLKKQNTRRIVFNSVWNQTHIQPIATIQHSFVIPVLVDWLVKLSRLCRRFLGICFLFSTMESSRFSISLCRRYFCREVRCESRPRRT